MKRIHELEYKTGSKEELLPDFDQGFPHIASYSELDKFSGRYVPWHWHKEVELFYVESGELEYYTPGGKTVFPAGSGGMVNSNVLHMTRPWSGEQSTNQMEHIFNVSIIGGQQGGIIEQKYVAPLTSATQIEIIGLYPESPEQAELLDMIRRSFDIDKNEYAYEIKLRSALSEIWCRLLAMSQPLLHTKSRRNKVGDRMKLMMVYIHEHFADKISAAEIAEAAYISERECFRAFRDSLHMSPVEYMTEYRLQRACRMLAESSLSVTEISLACGLGSSSYFGRVFHSAMGCTPVEYRSKWRDNNINGR